MTTTIGQRVRPYLLSRYYFISERKKLDIWLQAIVQWRHISFALRAFETLNFVFSLLINLLRSLIIIMSVDGMEWSGQV